MEKHFSRNSFTSSPMPPPPPIPGSANPQLHHHIHHLLSHPSLPYAADSKHIILHHLLSLSSFFPSLAATTTATTALLVSVDGTIPVSFYGVTYNIPIVIWLMESYPRGPPRVRVNPTRDMVIKQPSDSVDCEGVVRVGYLENWVFPGCDLVGLVMELVRVFGVDMPVYSRPRRDRDREKDGVVSSSSIGSEYVGSVHSGFGAIDSREHGASPYGDSYGGNPVMVSSNSSGSGFVGSAHSGFGARPWSPYGGFGAAPYVGGGRIVDDSGMVRRKLMDSLVERIHGDVVVMKKERELEMDGLLRMQAAMRQRGNEVERGLREMRHEMEGLEQELQVVLTNADVLGDWLKENEGKMEGLGKVNVDEVFEFCDGLSRQMAECMAADMAIEDVIYSLDRVVQDGVISFDVYLRNVRLLSREQFIHRATAGKIRAVQTQAQVSAMASRMSQFRV